MTTKEKVVNETLDWVIHIAIAIIIGILIVTFVAQRTVVHQVSMLPTLVEGDNLVVEKISPKIGALKRGDIIVFNSSEGGSRQLIKRLIALEGDKVEIKDGKVYVNGRADKISNPKDVETLPGDPKYNNIIVQKGYVYAMGDNRPDSHDCRAFGPIKISQISGRAIFRIFPFSKFGTI